MGLKNKAVSGIFWTFTQQFGVQAINFAVQIILARLLLPREFGLIAMITVFITIGNKLTDGGMTSSLIRTTNPDNEDYSTVFYINLLVSIVIYFILFYIAPWVARFFEHGVLKQLIRVLSLSIIIKAFVGVQTTRLTKEMRFKVQMMMQIPSLIIGGATGIFLAYRGFGVWSLVYMNLIGAILFTIQHWLFSGWKPAFVINKAKLKYHFNFGYKMTVAGLLNSFFDNIYNIIIGKFYTPALLGFYNRAYTLQLFPAQNISAALGKVTYPIFAAIQNDDKKLKKVYGDLMQQIIFWVAPLMIFAAVLARPLFTIVLTEKWLPAIHYFQILTIVGILYPMQQANLNILAVKGRSDLILKLNVYKKVALVVGILIAISFGVMGLVIMQALSAIVSYFYNSHYSGKFIGYSATEQIKDIAPLLILSTLCGAIILFCYNVLFDQWGEAPQILVSLFLGFGLYILLAWLLKFQALIVFKELIYKKLVNKIKGRKLKTLGNSK